MALLVPIQEISQFTGIDEQDDRLTVIANAVSLFFEKYTGRTFILTTFTNEPYNGFGMRNIFLRHIPLNTLIRVKAGQVGAVKVRTVATDCSGAILFTSPNLVRLTIFGGQYAGEATISATNLTLQELTTAISSTDGWQAELAESKYAELRAGDELFEGYIPCDTNWNYVLIPDELITVDYWTTYGKISYNEGFPAGRKNIFVTYKAGYNEIPEDIKLACMLAVQAIYEERETGTINADSFRLGDMSIDITPESMPRRVMAVLEGYKRWL